ncbi:MAG: hypothetical protein AMXMBFR4_06090 [Candidatus Hydrogenedentota bacterium]
MQMVSVATLAPGQVVAAPVTNSGGAILCPAGFTLTESAISRLQNAGIEFVSIQGDAATCENAAAHVRLENLEKRFSRVSDPILLELKDAVAARLNSALPSSPA